MVGKEFSPNDKEFELVRDISVILESLAEGEEVSPVDFIKHISAVEKLPCDYGAAILYAGMIENILALHDGNIN